MQLSWRPLHYKPERSKEGLVTFQRWSTVSQPDKFSKDRAGCWQKDERGEGTGKSEQTWSVSSKRQTCLRFFIHETHLQALTPLPWSSHETQVPQFTFRCPALCLPQSSISFSLEPFIFSASKSLCCSRNKYRDPQTDIMQQGETLKYTPQNEMPPSNPYPRSSGNPAEEETGVVEMRMKDTRRTAL